jgi:hypothetical protein
MQPILCPRVKLSIHSQPRRSTGRQPHYRAVISGKLLRR